MASGSTEAQVKVEIGKSQFIDVPKYRVEPQGCKAAIKYEFKCKSDKERDFCKFMKVYPKEGKHYLEFARPVCMERLDKED